MCLKWEHANGAPVGVSGAKNIRKVSDVNKPLVPWVGFRPLTPTYVVVVVFWVTKNKCHITRDLMPV